MVCERCEAERLTLLIYECGVMHCSACFLLGFRNNGGALAPCGQCLVVHEQVGLLLTSTGRIRHWFGEKRLVLLLIDLINRGYFWHDVPAMLSAEELLEGEQVLIEARESRLFHLRVERAEMSSLFTYQGGWALAPQTIQDLYLKQLDVNSDLLYLVDNCYFELFWLNVEN